MSLGGSRVKIIYEFYMNYKCKETKSILLVKMTREVRWQV